MVESGLILGRQQVFEPRQISAPDIKKIFGLDYKKVVADVLGNLGLLPDGHALNFFKTPIEHKGSKARYFLEELIGPNKMYVSFLDSNGKTTRHKHQDPIRETYLQLAGSSFLRIDDDFRELRAGSALTVLSDVPHQLTTREDPSLTLIVMKNAALVPADRLHIPVVL